VTPTSRLRLSRDLVLVGGGHAHALVLRAWAMDPLAGARLTVINPDPTAAYTGMLPGHVAGHYARRELDIDVLRLASRAGARLILDRACGVDLSARTIELENGPPVAFDVASLDVGVHGAVASAPGLAEHGAPAKPLGAFADRWERFVAEGGGPVAVAGGGVAGVELALAAAHRLAGRGAVCLIEARPDILEGLGRGARRALRRRLSAYGIEVLTGASVEAVEPGGVRLAGGRRVEAALTIGAAGAAPHAWLAASDLANAEGFVDIDRFLRASADEAVFAAGDCAHMPFAPREKAGVFAVRQAPILFRNLKAALREDGGPMKAYRPQKAYLKLISTGARHAVFERYGFAFGSAWAWRLKDRIDRDFMNRLNDLPSMEDAPPRETAADAVAGRALCAGCGAKAGRASLAGLARPGPGDAAGGPGDDAAVLEIGGALQVLSTDAVRGFTSDPRLLARVAAVHAMGDVWAMGARPRAALMTLTLPRMTPALEARTVAEATAAARAALAAAGADLVGGHTGLGAELSIGFAVVGLAERPIGLAGARPGDRLILTKPIGSGTILAGAMAGAADPDNVAACWRMMETSSAAAAETLAPIVRAMTDVTGFGLANHLLGLLDASGAAADLDPGAAPLLAGAEALAASGVRSSLFEANVEAAAGRAPPPESPRAALLYDPQTAGGLLAAAPADAAGRLIETLAGRGVRAAIIGEIVSGPPAIRSS